MSFYSQYYFLSGTMSGEFFARILPRSPSFTPCGCLQSARHEIDFKLPSAGWIAAIFIGILLIVGLWMPITRWDPTAGVGRRVGRFFADPSIRDCTSSCHLALMR